MQSTVRPFGPHYRAHPLRFCCFLQNHLTQRGKTYRTNRTYRTAAVAALDNSLTRRPAGAFCGRGRFGPSGLHGGRFGPSGLHAPFSVFRFPGRRLRRPLCPLWFPCALCGKDILAVLPAVAGQKSALICEICGSLHTGSPFRSPFSVLWGGTAAPSNPPIS